MSISSRVSAPATAMFVPQWNSRSMMDRPSADREGMLFRPSEAGSVPYSVNNPVPPGLPYGDPDYHVARFILGVNNDGVYNNSPGLLTISLDAGFTDTLGNPLGDPWRMTLVTTN